MRNLQISLLPTAALAFLLATPDALAQQEQSVGFGALKRQFNMTELAGTLPETIEDSQILGVAAWNGILYVSGRNGGSSSDHKIYIVDTETTTLLGSYTQPEPHASDTHGARDMATDLVGNLVTCGNRGVAVMDRAGNMLDSVISLAGPVMLDVDSNGFPAVTGDALDEIVGGNFESVAFDPAGDSGNGSFYVSNLQNTALWYELRITDSEIVRAFDSPDDATGLALDPETGSLWSNSNNETNGRGLIEMDLPNAVDSDGDGIWELMATGRQFPAPFSTAQGALDFMQGGDRGHPWASAWDLVSTARNEPGSDDNIVFNGVHQFVGVPGYTVSFLGGSTGMREIQNFPPVLYGPGDTLNWGMVSNGRPNLFGPGLDLINLGSDATQDGVSFLPGIGVFPELVALSFASQPAATVTLTNPTAVGDGTLASATSVTLPPTFPVNTSDTIRIQTVYFEPASPTIQLAASNELWFLGLDIKTIMFEMDAPTAYHVDLVNPFIRLTEFGGGGADTSIVKLIMDIQTTAANPENKWFDTVAGSMFDIFAAGNGTMYGCTGTYRGGSDVATGLIYSSDDTVNTIINLGRDNETGRGFEGAGYPACFIELWPDPTATVFPYQTGYLASNPDDPGDTDPDWYPDTLEFNFTPGMFLDTTFMFDLDIDGIPDSGRDLAGTYVEVHLQDGTIFTGLTFPDDTKPTRSITGW